MKNSISLGEVEQIIFRLAKEFLDFDEPIPEFNTRFPNILESCLAVPFQRFSGKSLYKTINKKAAILFYLMIKNHPFQNGNKRIGVITLLYYLYKNKRWLKVDPKAFHNFAMWVAQSPAELKKETIDAANHFIVRHTIKLI